MNRVADREATVRVSLGARSYDVVIGAGALDRAGALLASAVPGRRAAVVSDPRVAGLYLERLRWSLEDAGFVTTTHLVPEGEAAKSWESLGRLLEDLLATRIDRDATVVALGGGAVGDLAGAAAALALRGVGFVQAPTTLLAQIDSSVGGKTGVNSAHGKNLIGAFHQPRLVIADTDALDTLAPRELRAGYAECVKYALIDDAAFFAWLEAKAERLLAGAPAERTRAIAACCAAKARLVAEDEREAGRRALLNLGHTFGHALEAAAGYDGALVHGEAVAMGTAMAFDLSVRLGFCAEAERERVLAHFAQVGLPRTPPPALAAGWSARGLLERMANDKKARDGRPTFVLARGVGRAFLHRGAPEAEVLATLEAALAT